jgi:hypothetical protein
MVIREIENIVDAKIRKCKEECRKIFMPANIPLSKVVLRAIITFTAITPLAGTAIYAYAATRERIATVETKVESIKEDVAEIRRAAESSRAASYEVLVEIRKMRLDREP